MSFSAQSKKLFHFQAPLEVANPIFHYKSFFFFFWEKEIQDLDSYVVSSMGIENVPAI